MSISQFVSKENEAKFRTTKVHIKLLQRFHIYTKQKLNKYNKNTINNKLYDKKSYLKVIFKPFTEEKKNNKT